MVEVYRSSCGFHGNEETEDRQPQPRQYQKPRDEMAVVETCSL